MWQPLVFVEFEKLLFVFAHLAPVVKKFKALVHKGQTFDIVWNFLARELSSSSVRKICGYLESARFTSAFNS